MEQITTNSGWVFDVEYNYKPGYQTNDHDEPETMEIESIHYGGDLMELFDHFLSTEQIVDEIKTRIRESN
jgi:hypothetical protein